MGLDLWGARFDSSSIEATHPLAVGLADSHERATGARPSFVGAPYGADMRLLVNQAHVPTVMYGPGDVRVAHSADEHVSLGEVAIAAETLADWLLSDASS